MMSEDDDNPPALGSGVVPLEDLKTSIERAFAEAHAAGAGSDPEALPELPPEAEPEASPEERARLMNEAFGRVLDGMQELAEYRQHSRTH